MKALDYARLVLLAAIWGSSFVFMRIAAPVVGPFVTAQSRLFIGGIVLSVAFAAFGTSLAWRTHWKNFFAVGALNAAIPFSLFAYAALHLPSSLSAILNSTVPLFGALLAAVVGTERLTMRRAAGLAVGFAGVVVVSGIDPGNTPFDALGAIGACLLASICYAVTGVFMKKLSGDAETRSLTAGSVLAAGLLLLPALPLDGLPSSVPLRVVASLAGLALLCSALAYVLYFRLVRDIGPVRTLVVTYLIPVFGVLWATILLDEALPLGALTGGVLVVIGTILVTRN